MKQTIKTLKQLLNYTQSFENSDEFNASLLQMHKEGKISTDLFLDYLDITQVDIEEALEEALENEE